MKRALVAAATALTLAGCNMVYSNEPVFQAADADGARPLRTGLWVDDGQDCRFDETQPRASWPDCVDWFLVRPGTLAGYEKGELVEYPYLMTAGNPQVVQLLWMKDDQGRPVYMFGGLTPERLDADGRVTAYTSWPALCGPPPESGSSGGSNPGHGTLEPLPGMTMDPDKSNCRPDGKDAVRGAAQASRAWADKPGRAHWVRDGEE